MANSNNKKFKASWSLKIFLTIFILSLAAEFIANDKPIFVKYKNELLFPVFFKYPETKFSGDFATEADYKDPYVINLIKQDGFIIMPPVKYSYDTINYYLDTPPPTPPNINNILGTDDQGRDVFARLIYGVRVSILFGLSLTIISSIIGIILGAIQGYFAGKTDLIIQRIIEIWQGLPALFILVILSALVTPNFWWLLFILTLFSWTTLAGPIRIEFLKTRKMDYIKAAKASGISEINIIFKHIFPNAIVATITFIPFILSGSIVALTSLDFLGFGLPAGSASLGELLAQGKNNPESYWLGLTTFFTLSVILTCLIFVGEEIRDKFHKNKFRIH